MKRLFLTALAISLLLFSIACSSTQATNVNKDSQTKSPSNEKIELKLAFPGQDGDVKKLEMILQEFYKDNPNIAVKPIFVPNQTWGDYITKIKTMVAGGSAPDVARIAIQGAQGMVKEGLVSPIDQFIANDPKTQKDLKDIHPKVQSSYTVDGKLYGLAWDWNNVGIHFNTKMLQEAGLPLPPANWTLDDFLKYCKALTKEKDGKKVYAIALPHNYFAASAWLFNNEATMLNKDWTASTLDDPKAIEVFQLFQDLIYKYGYAPAPSPDNNYQTQFINGQVAMISAGRWPTAAYEKNNFTSVDTQYLPTLRTNQPILGSGTFFVMKASKNQEAAYKLAAFLGGDYSQRNYLDTLSVPTSIPVMNDLLPKGQIKNWKVFTESADKGKPVESPPQYTEIENIFNRYYSAILANQMDAATALKKAKQEIDAVLTKK